MYSTVLYFGDCFGWLDIQVKHFIHRETRRHLITFTFVHSCVSGTESCAYIRAQVECVCSYVRT